MSDHLGSSSIRTDATGTVTEQRDLKPYGTLSYENVATSSDNRYKFTGKERDTETALDYFGARYLDNQFGRFESLDPLLLRAPVAVIYDPQSLNSYAYVRNNPLVLVDPNGEDAVDYTRGAAKGFWRGLKDTGQAIIAIVQNPTVIVTSIVDLAQQSYNDFTDLSESYRTDPGGTRQQIRDAFDELAGSWNKLSDETKGEITGYALEKGLEAYVAVKGAQKGMGSSNAPRVTGTNLSIRSGMTRADLETQLGGWNKSVANTGNGTIYKDPTSGGTRQSVQLRGLRRRRHCEHLRYCRTLLAVDFIVDSCYIKGMKKIIQVHIYKGDMYYVAECLDLPVVTQGKTLDELTENLREAIALQLEGESLQDFDLAPDPSIMANVELDTRVYA